MSSFPARKLGESEIGDMGGVDGSVSLAPSFSGERSAFRETLDSVRHTINSLVDQPQAAAAAAAMTTPPRMHPHGLHEADMASAAAHAGPSHAPPPPPQQLEGLLSSIASRLGSIEGMYADMSARLVRVDGRVHANERSMRELQHLSAGAMHETARLVDYVGARTPPPAGSSGASGGATPPLAGRHAPTLGLRPASHHADYGSPAAVPRALDYVPGASPAQVTSTVQQHAAQIHKLIAGLDFLEQHIIRQDAVIDDVQKQAASAAQGPSELLLRVHDMSELLNKLRAHLYKVEKRSAGGEASVKELAVRLEAVEQRMQLGTSQMMVNPLYVDGASPVQRSVAAAEAAPALVTRAEFDALKQQMALNQQAALGHAQEVAGSTEQLQQRVACLEAELLLAREQAAAAREAADAASEEAAVAKELVEAATAEAELARVEAAKAATQAEEASKQAKEAREAVEAAVEAAAVATRHAERAADVAGGIEGATSAVAVLAESLNEMTAKAYDEQLLALQERVHRLDEEMRSGLADVRDYAVSLQAQDRLKSELEESMDTALAGIKDSVQTDLEQVMVEMDSLSQQVDSCVRSAQVSDLVSVSLAQGEAALRDILAKQAEEVSGMLQKLAGEVYDVKALSTRSAEGLREDVQLLEVRCQAEREALAVLGLQVVELADRLEATRSLAKEVQSVAEQQAEHWANRSLEQQELSEQMEQVLADQDRLKEAYANLILDLGEVRTVVTGCAQRADAASGLAQEAAAQARGAVAVAAGAPEVVRRSLGAEFVSRVQLHRIFAARADMARAVEQLEGALHGGTAAHDGAHLGAAPAASRHTAAPSFSPAAPASTTVPASAAEVEELRARQTEMQAQIDRLLLTQRSGQATSAVDDAVHVYRSDAAVPVYRSDHVVPVYRSDHVVPVYRSEQTVPVYRSDHTVPVYRSEAAVPMYDADGAVSGYRSQQSVPVYRSEAAVPVYRSEAAVPVYRTEVAAPSYRSESAAPVFTSAAPAPVVAQRADQAVQAVQASDHAVRDAAASVAAAAAAAAVEELRARQSEMQSRIDLLLYRSDQAVRHEQLDKVAKAVMALEVQVKQELAALGSVPAGRRVPLVPAASPMAQQQGAEEEDGLARMDDLEEQVSLLREAISSEVKTTQVSNQDVMEAVHDLQLMVVELRSEGVARVLQALHEKQGAGGGSSEGGAGLEGGERKEEPYSFVSKGWDSPRPASSGRKGPLLRDRRGSGLAGQGAGEAGPQGGGTLVVAGPEIEELKATVAALAADVAALQQQQQQQQQQQKVALAGGALGAGGMGMHVARSTEGSPSRLPMLVPMPPAITPLAANTRAAAREGEGLSGGSNAVSVPHSPAVETPRTGLGADAGAAAATAALSRLERRVKALEAQLSAAAGGEMTPGSASALASSVRGLSEALAEVQGKAATVAATAESAASAAVAADAKAGVCLAEVSGAQSLLRDLAARVAEVTGAAAALQAGQDETRAELAQLQGGAQGLREGMQGMGGALGRLESQAAGADSVSAQLEALGGIVERLEGQVQAHDAFIVDLMLSEQGTATGAGPSRQASGGSVPPSPQRRPVGSGAGVSLGAMEELVQRVGSVEVAVAESAAAVEALKEKVAAGAAAAAEVVVEQRLGAIEAAVGVTAEAAAAMGRRLESAEAALNAAGGARLTGAGSGGSAGDDAQRSQAVWSVLERLEGQVQAHDAFIVDLMLSEQGTNAGAAGAAGGQRSGGSVPPSPQRRLVGPGVGMGVMEDRAQRVGAVEVAAAESAAAVEALSGVVAAGAAAAAEVVVEQRLGAIEAVVGVTAEATAAVGRRLEGAQAALSAVVEEGTDAGAQRLEAVWAVLERLEGQVLAHDTLIVDLMLSEQGTTSGAATGAGPSGQGSVPPSPQRRPVGSGAGVSLGAMEELVQRVAGMEAAVLAVETRMNGEEAALAATKLEVRLQGMEAAAAAATAVAAVMEARMGGLEAALRSRLHGVEVKAEAVTSLERRLSQTDVTVALLAAELADDMAAVAAANATRAGSSGHGDSAAPGSGAAGGESTAAALSRAQEVDALSAALAATERHVSELVARVCRVEEALRATPHALEARLHGVEAKAEAVTTLERRLSKTDVAIAMLAAELADDMALVTAAAASKAGGSGIGGVDSHGVAAGAQQAGASSRGEADGASQAYSASESNVLSAALGAAERRLAEVVARVEGLEAQQQGLARALAQARAQLLHAQAEAEAGWVGAGGVGAGGGGAAAGEAGLVQALADRLQQLERQVQQHAQGPASVHDVGGETGSALGALADQVAQLAQQAAGDREELGVLAGVLQQVQAQQQQQQQQRQPSRESMPEAELSDLSAKVLELTQKVQGASASSNEELAALGAKVQQLQLQVLGQQQQQEQGGITPQGTPLHGTPMQRTPRSSTAGGADSQATGPLEARVGDHGKALHLLRSRLIALQELLEATRSAMTELQGGQGSVAARLDGLAAAVEALEKRAAGNEGSLVQGVQPVQASGGADGRAGAAAAAAGEVAGLVGPLKEEVAALRSAVSAMQPCVLDASHALELATKLGPRVGEAEQRLAELAAKVSEVGGAVAPLPGAVSALERSVTARVRRVGEGLDTLTQQLRDISSIQKPTSKNPFSVIAPAGSNPAVLLLDARFEAMRLALCDYSKNTSEELK